MNYLLIGILGFICLLALIFVIVLFKRYKASHPEKYFGGEAFKVRLMSITPEITVFSELSQSQNIIIAKKQFIAEIIVQQTSNDEYFREILTGKLIPISTMRVHGDHVYYDNYYHPVFAEFGDLYSKRGDYVKTFLNPLKKVTATNLEQYIREHRGMFEGFDSFLNYLNFIFEQGETYYKNSFAKTQENEEKLVREILDNLKAIQQIQNSKEIALQTVLSDKLDIENILSRFPSEQTTSQNFISDDSKSNNFMPSENAIAFNPNTNHEIQNDFQAKL